MGDHPGGPPGVITISSENAQAHWIRPLHISKPLKARACLAAVFSGCIRFRYGLVLVPAAPAETQTKPERNQNETTPSQKFQPRGRNVPLRAPIMSKSRSRRSISFANVSTFVTPVYPAPRSIRLSPGHPAPTLGPSRHGSPSTGGTSSSASWCILARAPW